MGQLYVPDGTWTLCSQGKKVVKIQVTSQSTVKIEGGHLAATEQDRFDDNFVCPPMMAAGAIVGVVVAAAIVSSGPAILVFAAGAIGAVAGGTILANHLPSVCSLLCKGSEWTALHPNVKITGKRALLQNATLSCLLGGTITLKMPNYQESIDMGLLAGNAVYGDLSGLTKEEEERIDDKHYHKLTETEISKLNLPISLFGTTEKTGYHAELYQTRDKYVLVFRGTNGGKDWVEDGKQGTGVSSEYYDKAVKLVKTMKAKGIFRAQNTTITGHSLAGGMTTIAAGASGFPAYTYNAAGVHDATLSRNQVHRSDMNCVEAYNGSSDILNALQDSREGFLMTLGWPGKILSKTGALPRAAGQRMEIETGFPLQGETGGHAAINIVRALEKEAANSASQTVFEKNI